MAEQKSYEEMMTEIKAMIADWKAKPYTQEEIDRLSMEIQERVFHRPHIKDWEKDKE
jgi:hypothetical protein